MNLLLSDFNEQTNHELDILLSNYQEYFIFQKDNDEKTKLYLDVNNLENYLINGKEIKFKKFIFLYLENIISKRKNNNYSYIKKNKSINFNQYYNNFIFDEFLDKKDYNNLNKILNLNKKFIEKDNIFYINDKYIYKLNEYLYIDVKKGRFYYKNYNKDKTVFYYDSIIINNYSSFKNQIICLLQLLIFDKYLINKNININDKKSFIINTKSNLIFCEKIYFDLWKKNIKKIFGNDVKILELTGNKSSQNYKNCDILDSNFILYNIDNINTNNKIFIYKNSTYNFKKEIIYEAINNSLYEASYNKNILESNFDNLFLFNWNSIIIDKIEKIIKIEFHLINYLNSNRLKIFLTNSICIDYLNIFINLSIKNTEKYSIDNFYNLCKNELIIQNLNNTLLKIEDINLIEIESDIEDRIILNKYKQKNLNKEISLLSMKSINDYFYYDTKNNIKKILQNKNKNKYLDNIFSNNLNNCVCCICMDKIEEKDFCILECGHYFCKSCIILHKFNNSNKNACPICRKNYNLIYNFNDKNNKISNKLKQLIEIIEKEKEKNIVIIAEYEEILDYINKKIGHQYNIHNYSKKKIIKNKNKNILLITSKLINKNIIFDTDVLIFIDIYDKDNKKFKDIKNKYIEYFYDVKKIKFYLLVDKFII